MADSTSECAIAWRRGDDYAEVTAYNGSRLKNRVMKLQKENPEDVKILAVNKDGSIFAHVPIQYVPNLRVTRRVSEEFRLKSSERLKNMRAERTKVTAEEPFFE